MLYLVTLSDPQLPQITSVSTFCIDLHIFVIGGDSGFKFDVQINHGKF